MGKMYEALQQLYYIASSQWGKWGGQMVRTNHWLNVPFLNNEGPGYLLPFYKI